MKKIMGIAMVAILFSGAAQAEVIASYDAFANPVSNGVWLVENPTNGAWTVNYFANDVATNGLPSGITMWGHGTAPAWVVTDGTNNAHANYSYTLDAAEKAAMTNLGWKLTVDVKVNWDRPAADDDVMTQLTTSDGGYRLRFGRHDGYNHAVEVLSWDGSWYVMATYVDGDESVTSALYHRHELVYDPATQTLDLFIDGVERLSNMESSFHGSVGSTLTWGSASTENIGEGRFREVTLETASSTLGSFSSIQYIMAKEVSWPSTNAALYQVQSSPSGLADWSDVGTFVRGNGSTNVVIDLPDAEPTDYRVLKLY